MQSLYGAIADTNKKEIMAISVDRVYQKVLAIANKEQRGYITPQEFNLFADQAQMAIFEQYFYDLEQRQRGPGNSFDYADIVSNIEEKISLFEVQNDIHSLNDNSALNVPLDVYRLGVVRVRYTNGVTGNSNYNYNNLDATTFYLAEQVQQKEIDLYMKSYFTNKFGGPYYTKGRSGGSYILNVFPTASSFGTIEINYIRRPSIPQWTYVISDGLNALYNPSDAGHANFEIHASEENKLVVKILQLAGVTIKDFNLVQAATQEEVKTIQQEKQ